MAVIQSEFSFSSSPKWKGIFEATETGRNGSSVTFKIVAKLKLDGTSSSTFYGYAVNWRATLNGVSSGTLKVKDASPKWYGGEGYRTFTTTLTTSVGASGGTVPLKIEVLASGGGNVSLNKTYNVGYSTWNTPPSMSGSLSLNRSGTIAENIGDVTLSWTKASDSNNNLSGYQIYRYVNGSHNATFDVGASATSYKDTISGFGQGTSIYYKIWAKDSYGEWSGALTSATITKNTMTSATLNISGSIGFNTKTVSVSYSGAKNTNGNTSFSYTLSSSNITVYNGSAITGTPFNLTIVRDGETKPSTPYILFNDVKTFTSGGSNWQRSITFKLDTKNGYGTTKNTTKAINSDLRIEPIAPSTITTSGVISLSDGRKYYIPDRGNITVAWSGASDRLGGSLKYDVYGKLGSGSYTILKSGLTGTSTTVTLGAVTSASNYTFKVVAITSYSKSSSLEGVPIELHYYKAPSIDFNNINRTANGLTVDVITKANTSIPSVGFTKRAYSGVVSGTLTKTPQTVSASNLADDKTYTLKVNITDDTGLSAEQTKSLTIPVYTPIMSVREKGVGVNAIPNGEGNTKLVVGGGAKISQGFYVHSAGANGGVTGYLNIATITVTNNYQNSPIEFKISQRGRKSQPTLTLMFTNANNTTPTVSSFTKSTDDVTAWVKDNGNGTYDIYVQKSEGYDKVDIMDLNKGSYLSGTSVTWKDVFLDAIPSGSKSASLYGGLTFDKIYPVGSIYMSTSSTNPSSYFGGTWVSWGSGRVPVGINTGDTDFSTVEKTGGAKTHTLTVAQMPSHTHVQNAHTHTQNAHTHTQNAHTHGVRYRGYTGVSASTSGHVLLRRNASDDPYDGTDGDSALSTTATNQNTTATNNNTTATNQNTGGGSAHNNLQPYIVCYMWKRTA